MAHQLKLISSVAPIRDLQCLQITINALYKGLLVEGVVKHLDDAGGTLIAYNIKHFHNLALGFHIISHWTHIEEAAVAISVFGFVSVENFHHIVLGMKLSKRSLWLYTSHN